MDKKFYKTYIGMAIAVVLGIIGTYFFIIGWLFGDMLIFFFGFLLWMFSVALYRVRKDDFHRALFPPIIEPKLLKICDMCRKQIEVKSETCEFCGTEYSNLSIIRDLIAIVATRPDQKEAAKKKLIGMDYLASEEIKKYIASENAGNRKDFEEVLKELKVIKQPNEY